MTREQQKPNAHSRATEDLDRSLDESALSQLISMLPSNSKAELKPLLEMRATERENAVELDMELLSELRRSLNEAAVKGTLDRRAFLKIASLLVTSGLGAMIFPQSAEAMYNMGAFWKRKKAAGSVSASSNPWGSTSLDPYWDYVTLLMQFDGANGTATFADESNVGKTATINGAPYIDASSSPFSGGKGSVVFSGAANYLSYADCPDWNFTGDFTIEAWANHSNNTDSHVFLAQYAPRSLLAGITSGKVLVEFSTDGSSYSSFVGNNTLAINTWNHIAISRSGSTVRIFTNGTLDSTVTFAGALYDANQSLIVGRNSNGLNPFVGKLADLRVYNGVAKYTANFSVPTAPIGLGSTKDSNWSKCVLACPFDTSMKDMSGKRLTPTSVTLTTAEKVFGTSSGSFAGGGTYVLAPDSEDYEFGSGDFTVEAWVKFNSVSSGTVISKGGQGAEYEPWSIYVSSGKLQIYASTNGSSYNLFAGTLYGSVTTGTWYHIALVRSGQAFTGYINGTGYFLGTTSSALNNNAGMLGIGTNASSTAPFAASTFNGYIDSLRITKGVARYTANFTAPTAAFPVGKDETVDPFWSVTVLHLQMTGSNNGTTFTDSTGRHTITANGTAKTSTTSYKWTTSSGYSDGGGTAYLSTSSPLSDFDFGGNDFTIEFWLNPSALTDNKYVFKMDSNDDAYCYWSSAQNGLLFYWTNTTPAGFNTTIPAAYFTVGNWHHVAFVRRANSILGFVNGALAVTNSGISGTQSLSTAAFYVWSPPSSLNSYIQDFRVTKGIARYVHGFVPPSKAFAPVGDGTTVYKGYTAGGTSRTTIDSLVFPVETVLTTLSVLATGATSRIGVNSSTKGYAIGGYTAASVNLSEIDSLTFSSESRAALSATLSSVRWGAGKANSGTKGYTFGGYSSSGDTTAIDRLTYSTEANAVLAATVPASTVGYEMCGVSSSSAGYCMGGGGGQGFQGIDKLTFSNETVANVANLPYTRCNCMGGSNSSTKGYLTSNGNNSNTTAIIGFTFSSETAAALSTTLSSARYDACGISSDAKGYTCGGYASTVVDGLVFANDTNSALSTRISSNASGAAGFQSGGYL